MLVHVTILKQAVEYRLGPLMSRFVVNAVMLATGIPVALSPVIAIIWLLGVPGTDGPYANGWRIGFLVVLAYPMAWIRTYQTSRKHRTTTAPAEQLGIDQQAALRMVLYFASGAIGIWYAVSLMQ